MNNHKKRRRQVKNKQFDPAVQSSFQADENSRQDIDQINQKQNERKLTRIRSSSNNLKRNFQQQTAGGESVEGAMLPQPYEFLKFSTPSLHMIFFPHFTVKSVTFVLSIILLVLFIVLIAYSYSKTQNDFTWNCSLFQLQNKFFPRLRYDYEFWRVLVSGFFHSNIAHFILNVFGIQLYGYFVQWYYGKIKLIITLGLSVILSHFFSAAVAKQSVSTMASCLLYSIIALKLWFLYEYREYKPLEHRKILIYLLLALVAGINLIPIFVANNVDWSSHLGGFITGGLIGTYLHFTKEEQNISTDEQRSEYQKLWKVIKWSSLVALGGFLIACIAVIFTTDTDTLYAMNYKIDEKCV